MQITKEAPSLPAVPRLPVTRGLTFPYLGSALVALLMVMASAVAFLAPERIYPTEVMLQSALSNDVVNLVIGLPILLGSMWFARRGKLLGLLFWPGALFYVPYNYLVNLLSVPIHEGFLLYLLLVPLGLYTLTALLSSIDAEAVHAQLDGAGYERLAGGLLAFLGVAYGLRVLGIVVGEVGSPTPLPRNEIALLIADFFVSPAWVIAGILLWQRKPLGYVLGTGLLFQLSALFVGVILLMLIQPLLTSAPFLLTDTLVLVGMSLFCFVPFALFTRAILRRA